MDIGCKTGVVDCNRRGIERAHKNVAFESRRIGLLAVQCSAGLYQGKVAAMYSSMRYGYLQGGNDMERID